MRIPITIVTGFLGAGKSTLINRIIRDNPGTRFGIVVNEFGDVKLESQFIDALGSGITELPNGCMCCVVRGDLIAAVESLLERDPMISHIIIEASGLSDPVPIAATFLDYEAQSDLYLDAIACVIDGERFFDAIDAFQIAAQQILFSDFVLISKASSLAAHTIKNLMAAIKPMRPKGRIFLMDAGFSTDLLVDPIQGDHGDIRNLQILEHEHDHDEHDHDHGHDGMHGDEAPYRHLHEHVDTVFYTNDAKLDPGRFGEFLSSLPPSLARAKGFVHFGGPKADGAKYLVQVVGQRPDMERREWGENEKRQCALVFIGRGLDETELRHRLAGAMTA